MQHIFQYSLLSKGKDSAIEKHCTQVVNYVLRDRKVVAAEGMGRTGMDMMEEVVTSADGMGEVVTAADGMGESGDRERTEVDKMVAVEMVENSEVETKASAAKVVMM